MRHLLLGITLLMTAGDRTANRDALLAADRALSDRTASLGMVQGFVPVLDHGAAYLYPGAPLLRAAITFDRFSRVPTRSYNRHGRPPSPTFPRTAVWATRMAGRARAERKANTSRAGRRHTMGGGSRRLRVRAPSPCPTRLPFRPPSRSTARSAPRCAAVPIRVS